MLRRIRKTSKLMLRFALSSPRFIIVILLLAMVLYDGINRVNVFAKENDVGIAPYLFPHMTSMDVLQIILLACYMAIISDIPYINKNSYPLLLRSGKRAWILNVFVVVQSMAFIYVLALFIISVVYILPSVTLTGDWGIALKTLSIDENSKSYIMFAISEGIIANFGSIAACIHAFLLEYLILIFLAFLMLAVNFITKSRVGIFVAFAVAAFDLAVSFTLGEAYYKYSPASFARLENLSLQDLGMKATPSTAYIVLISGIIIFAAVSYYLFQKNSLETMSEGANA